MLLQPTQSKGENIMSAATMKNQSPKDETDIRALIEGIHKAHHNKDAATIVSPYAQDVVVCDLAPPLSHHGQDRESKQAWLDTRSEEHTSELQSRSDLVCRLLLEKKKKKIKN